MKLSEIQTGTFLLAQGAPGTGKTSAMRNMVDQDMMVLTNEPRQLRVLRQWNVDEIDAVTVRTYQEWKTAIRDIPKHKKYLVVDSATSLHDELFRTHLENNPALKDMRSAYGAVMQQFKEVMWSLKKLADNGMHVVVIVHQKDIVEGVGEGQKTKRVPDLPGGLPMWLYRNADVAVRHLCYSVDKKETRYEVTVDGADENVGKDWSNRLAKFEPNDYLWIIMKLRGVVEGDYNAPKINEPPKISSAPKEKKKRMRKKKPAPREAEVEAMPEAEVSLRAEILKAGSSKGLTPQLIEVWVSSTLEKKWDDLGMEELQKTLDFIND